MSLPKPDAPNPPCGISLTMGMWSLIHTQPALICQRVVPRGNGGDHPGGLSADAGGVVGRIFGGCLTFQMSCGTGEKLDIVDAAGHIELCCQAHRLTRLGDLLGDQCVRVGRHAGGQFGQDSGTVAVG